MTSTTVFSGNFSTSVNGATAQKFSYDGSMETKNKTISLDLATDFDGVKDRLAVKGVSPDQLATNPKILAFMRKMQAVKTKKPPRKKTARRPYTSRRKRRRIRIRTRAA